MKLNSLTKIVMLAGFLCYASVAGAQEPPPTTPAVPPVPSVPAREQKKPHPKTKQTKVKVHKTVEREERSIIVEPDVVINLCMEAGRVTVRGTERREVRAWIPKGSHLDFRRAYEENAAHPAKRLEVMLSEPPDDDEAEPHYRQCGGAGNVELEVPRDATLFFKSENGGFDVEAVAEVHIETHNGPVTMRNITRATEATSIAGDISLENSSGRVRLKSFNGSVEALNVRKVAEGDFFKVESVSDDVTLENVSHTRVEVSTISGEITVSGALARGARYDLRTTSGDITLALPDNASFKLTAKVSESGEIVTDFPLKYTSGLTSSALLTGGRMVGTHGTGDATINLISFSGTLRLQRQ